MKIQTARTRALNDHLRRTLTGGTLLLTPGIQSLDTAVLRRVVLAIARFEAFDAANDPHDEHDFGSVSIASRTVFFKIDYYDLDLRNHSPDPADPDVTRLQRGNQDETGASIKMRRAGLATKGGRSPTGVASPARARSCGVGVW